MPELVSEVTRLVRALAPDYEYRWTDAAIRRCAHLADLAVCEGAAHVWRSTDITLVENVYSYDLPVDVLSVQAVRYSPDGISYDRVLTRVPARMLDRYSQRWQADTGFPGHYALLSHPGIDGYSKLIVWRKLASAGGETLRVEYTASRAPTDAVTLPATIIQDVYLPYVISLLRAAEEPPEAAAAMRQFKDGMPRARLQLTHRGLETKRVRGGVL
jgi:hypothetical protein